MWITSKENQGLKVLEKWGGSSVKLIFYVFLEQMTAGQNKQIINNKKCVTTTNKKNIYRYVYINKTKSKKGTQTEVGRRACFHCYSWVIKLRRLVCKVSHDLGFTHKLRVLYTNTSPAHDTDLKYVADVSFASSL